MTETNQHENKNIITQQLQKSPKYKSLFVVHVNLNGFTTNGYKLKEQFFKDDYGPDVICISETHGSENAPDLNTSKINYTQFFFYRRLTDWSGVGMYVNSSLRYKERKDLSEIIVTNSVHLWVELTDDYGRQIVVGVVYRHEKKVKNQLCQDIKPKGATQFLKDLNVITTKIKKENKKFYVLGDFNIDLKESENKRYKELLKNHKYEQLITATTYGNSLIDHIYTYYSENDDPVPAGVAKDLGKPVFDHTPIYCFIPLQAFYCNVESKVIINLLDSIQFRFKLFEKDFFGESKNFMKTHFLNTFSLLKIQINSLKNQFFAIEKEFKTLTDFFDQDEKNPFQEGGQLMLKYFEEIRKLLNSIDKEKLLESQKIIKKFIHDISRLLDNMQIPDLLKILKSVYCSEDNEDLKSDQDVEPEYSENDQDAESEDSENDQDAESEDSKNDQDAESEYSENDQEFEPHTSTEDAVAWNKLKSIEYVSDDLTIYLRKISLAYIKKVSNLKKFLQTRMSEKHKVLDQCLQNCTKDTIKLSDFLRKVKPKIDSNSYKILENHLLNLSPVKCLCVKTFLEKFEKLYDQLKIELVEVKKIFYIFVLETAYKFLEEL